MTSVRVACAGLVVALTAALVAADDKDLSIEEFMGKHHAGKSATLNRLDTGAKAATPDWNEVQKLAADYAQAAPKVGKNTPPRNADKKDEWAKITGELAENAKAIDTAAKAKDKEGVAKGVKMVRGMCARCHGEFRPKD
jgi:cytochrome c556